MAWIDRDLSRFEAFPGSVCEPPDEATQTVFCEFALLLLVLGRQARFADDRRLRRWLAHLIAAYQQPVFHAYLLVGHPLAFTGHLILWLALTPHLKEVLTPREAIQHRLDHSDVARLPRSPERVLELRYFLELGHFQHDLPSDRELYEQFGLADFIAPSDAIAETDVYAATHLVFYLTDFGRQLPSFVTPAAAGDLQAFLGVCLDIAVESGHWDLVAELLLALQCWPAPEMPTLVDGWRALQQAQDPSGAILEGPDQAMLALTPHRALSHTEFLLLYHRVLVTTLAAYVGQTGGGIR